MARGSVKYHGGWLLAAAAALGLAVSIYIYLTPESGVAGTQGAILVIVSTALLLVAALLLIWDGLPPALRVLFVLLAGLDIIGTAFAGWLLNSQILAGLMAVGAIGWLLYVFGGPRIQ